MLRLYFRMHIGCGLFIGVVIMGFLVFELIVGIQFPKVRGVFGESKIY